MSRFVSPAFCGGTLLTTLVGLPLVATAKPATSEGASFSLMRPVSLSGEKDRGTIDVRRRLDDGRSRIRVIVKGQGDGASALSLFMEEPAQSGTLVDIGPLSPTDGGHRLKIDTKKGDSLPFGAASIVDLVGRRVEVRRGDGSVRLVGAVPAPVKKESVDHDKQSLDGFSGSKGGLHVVERHKHGSTFMTLHGGGLPAGSDLAFQVDDGAGKLITVAMVEVGENGKAKLKVDTKKGDPLPFGVLSLEALAGRPIELCDPGQDGLVLLAGAFP